MEIQEILQDKKQLKKNIDSLIYDFIKKHKEVFPKIHVEISYEEMSSREKIITLVNTKINLEL